MSRDMSRVTAHTVRATTYPAEPEMNDMMGNIKQAAQVANALSGISPALRNIAKITHYGSYGLAAGFLGGMVGASLSEGSLRPMASLSKFGIVGGLLVLSAFTLKGARN